MTVSTTLNKITYVGDGSTTVFPFSFPAVAAADIQVLFTDLNGNITTLVQGPGAAQYQLVLNPPISPNPTATGGTVTYNPLGTPIPLGTQLTIIRVLPLNQQTSFANQGALYQSVIEQTFDFITMLAQQVLEVQNRALNVAVSDPIPSTLPAVASRKNLVLGFDNNGNPIAVSTAPAGTISSAMAPVVNAASIATARTLLGLGAMATEGIGSGLQDDGVGNARTFYNNVSDAISQTVTATFHANVRAATGAITYTLPLSSTLWNGFGFWIYALTNTVTIAPNAADSFSGAATGVSLSIPSGSKVFISTTAAGTWYIRGNAPVPFGPPANYSLAVSVAAGAMTIALKDGLGNDPSPASPVLVNFVNGGTSIPRAITGPLSVTVPSGASLGTVNGVASRIWVGLFDNAGTPILGVYNSLTNSNPNYSILPWTETVQAATTGISAGSTSAQVWYTSSALVARPLRVIGMVESTQPTAGTWSVTPGWFLYAPGMRKPGDIVSEANVRNTTQDSTTSATYAVLPHNEIAVTPINFANLYRVRVVGPLGMNGNGGGIALSRGTVNNTNIIGGTCDIGVVASVGGILEAYDIPGANVTYAVQGLTVSASTLSFPAATGVANTVNAVSLTAEEIMV